MYVFSRCYLVCILFHAHSLALALSMCVKMSEVYRPIRFRFNDNCSNFRVNVDEYCLNWGFDGGEGGGGEGERKNVDF